MWDTEGLESIKPELWQEGYINLDITAFKGSDYEKIRKAAVERQAWLSINAE